MTAIIVDDEKHCREVLELMLGKYCPEIKLLGNYAGGIEALEVLKKQTPDILFLDIEMPGMNGFELLEQAPEGAYETIFTTAYNEYAIKAIKHSALDYLLKPIDKDELQLAVHRAMEHKAVRSPERIKELLDILQHPKTARRFAGA